MAGEDPVVTVKQGQLCGAIDTNVYGGKFLAFRGIPYAKPPTGPLRFKDPQPVEPWTGIKEAKEFGNSCGQVDFFSHQIIGSDDCLYLNVYTPTIDASLKRAVMVWIHGGGFVCGSGDSSIYGPDYIVQKDVVLVTINYRLGVYGFLNLETEEAPGNQGLKDLVMGLKWVQENISNFGGDPNNVTIFGESAGGAAVHYLCISPMSQGLFHKAIAQSGVSTNPWAIWSKNFKKHAFELVADLGKKTTDPQEAVEFLRTIDPSKLTDAQQKQLLRKGSLILIGLFGPTIDSKSSNPFLPQHPSILAKAGINVPLLLGNTNNEGSLFVSSLLHTDLKKALQSLDSNFGAIVHPEIEESMQTDGITPEQLRRLYFADKAINFNSRVEFAAYLTDMMFLKGIIDTVKIQTEMNLPAYYYKFTYEPEISLTKQRLGIDAQGATHSEELMYLFYPYLMKNLGLPPPSRGSKDHNVMEYLTQMWTDFAKTGNPTPMTTDLITTLWKPIGKKDAIEYMNIGEKLRMETMKLEEHTSNWKLMKNKL